MFQLSLDNSLLSRNTYSTGLVLLYLTSINPYLTIPLLHLTILNLFITNLDSYLMSLLPHITNLDLFTCVAEGESRSRSALTPSVCPSVCPSVPQSCHKNSSETTDPIIM